MYSINQSVECNLILDKISYLLIIISFFVGVIFFSKSKNTSSLPNNVNHKEIELIEKEQSFFIDNQDEFIRR